MSVIGNAIMLSGGGSSSNKILEETRIFVPGSSYQSVELTLPKAVSKCVVYIEASDTTITAILAQTGSSYYLLYGVALYPGLENNSVTVDIYGIIARYRGSTGTASSIIPTNLSLSGTSLTISFASNFFYPQNGEYKFTVYELID